MPETWHIDPLEPVRNEHDTHSTPCSCKSDIEIICQYSAFPLSSVVHNQFRWMNLHDSHPQLKSPQPNATCPRKLDTSPLSIVAQCCMYAASYWTQGVATKQRSLGEVASSHCSRTFWFFSIQNFAACNAACMFKLHTP